MAVDNDIYIFAYNFANVGMKPDHNGWDIFVHLHNKKSPKIWRTRCGIRELGVSYCWGLSTGLRAIHQYFFVIYTQNGIRYYNDTYTDTL